MYNLEKPTEWKKYETREGDTFDSLAKEAYDDECMASLIIEENPDYADVLIFEAGTILFIPVYDTIVNSEYLPPWRQTDES